MVDIEERAAVIALVRRGGASWPGLADQIAAHSSALELLRRSGRAAQDALFELPPEDVPLGPIIEEIRGWEREDIRLLTVLDRDYPLNLRLVREQPPFLFAKGEVRDDEVSVAVIGTRHPSAAGLRQAADIAGGLAERGVTVASGLAMGIDTAAHSAALEAGGRTVAVIGTGLRHAYPAQNAALQRRISEVGLVLSQFWPDASPTKQTFPMRNAVMSGYCLATVVIEAQERSGARLQARLALEHGRRVFLMRSLLKQEWARAYEKRPNTTVVDTAEQVFDTLDTLRPKPAEQLTWA